MPRVGKYRTISSSTQTASKRAREQYEAASNPELRRPRRAEERTRAMEGRAGLPCARRLQKGERSPESAHRDSEGLEPNDGAAKAARDLL